MEKFFINSLSWKEGEKEREREKPETPTKTIVIYFDKLAMKNYFSTHKNWARWKKLYHFL